MFASSVIRNSVNKCVRGFNTVTVIGAGVMGTGIAQLGLNIGYNIMLHDSDDKVLLKSTQTLKNNLSRIAQRKYGENESASIGFVDTRMCHLNVSTELCEAVSQADLVIEAIVENLSAKQDLFRMIEPHAPSTCILTTNTSSMTIRDIGSVLKDQTRFAGLHFFQPVSALKLVEIVRGEHTSDATHTALFDFVRSLNKTPITCKDTPGFVVNRLLVPCLLDAVRMVERGDSCIEDIDIGMKLGAGHPMGPFELADMVGLDTVQQICQSFVTEMPDNPNFLCPPLINRLVSENKLGKKTGEGFYKYDKKREKNTV